jgi:hypothetical protein
MKKHIPTLMEVYQEMVKENKKFGEQEKKRKNEWKSTPARPYFFTYCNPYSDTMLHNLVSIINKLNNHHD